MSLRIWGNLPEKYRASCHPETPITLWRADHVGLEKTGLRCHLPLYADPETIVYESLFVKYPSIKTLIKRHIQNSGIGSPFVSLTDQLAVTRKFSSGKNETIYEITLPAYRFALDPPDPDETPLVEALAIGRIEPSEITAVMLHDDPNKLAEGIVWDRSMSWVQ